MTMDQSKIIKILDAHSIPHYESNMEIYADSMISGTALFEKVENVTDWTCEMLFDWLGY